MHARITRGLRRGARWMLIGAAGAAGALLAGDSANAAAIATFNNGVLTVFGDSGANTITVSRDAAGTILVNSGAITVIGGRPTVANTALIQVFGVSGNDVIRLVETNGALPRANLFGGAGYDTLSGGAGGDLLFGQSGNDTLEGRGGFDSLLGGAGNDNLVGGDADDRAFGDSGDDILTWNPGDDTDLNEGGAGRDTVRVIGGNGAEAFTTTANGTRVRFDRVDPAPFAIDIGTSERLELTANGGNDSFSATGNLAPLIAITADGGAGADTLLGSNGVDLLIGGDDNDFVDGQQGNDTALVGNGNDTFQWDPGDGSDVVEGQGGTDTMVFNGNGANERFVATANGQRLRFTRDVGNIIMDTNDLEVVRVNALGGTDTTTVDDLSGTDVVEINADLAGVLGGTTGDALADTVVVNGTNGADIIDLFGGGDAVSVRGLAADVNITRSEGANDALVVNALGANDGLTATTLPAGVITATLDGGAGDDRILGSQGADTLLGGDGADFTFGDNGNDVARLGIGDDRFQWDPGDGSDTVEGQEGADVMDFFGSNQTEDFDVSANGGRVRFFRNVANITMDLDDVESIELRALGGVDNVVVDDLTATDLTSFSADLLGASGGGDGAADTITVNGTAGADTFGAAGDSGGVNVFGLHTAVNVFFQEAANDKLVLNGEGGDDIVNAASLRADGIQLAENGGLGADTLTGSDGADAVLGGDGNDVAVMGAGDDVFTWNPGDDNDTIEGQAGSDRMLFAGANVSEDIDVSANGGRVRFFRNVANVIMDLNDVEGIDFNALGGADNVTVNDLSGTDAVRVGVNLGAGGGGGDGAADNVTVLGTNGDDVALVNGSAAGVSVLNLAAQVDIVSSEAANDVLTVNALAGDDVIEASALQAGALRLVEAGGDGDDVLIGSAGDDVIQGGAGDDVLVGGGGFDILDGGDGDDIEIPNLVAEPGTSLVATSTDQVTSATTADAEWIANHVQIVDGRTVITINGRTYQLSGIDLSQLVADAAALIASLPAPVGDFVWADGNGNGLQDAGELGLGGVVVRLRDANGGVVGETVTGGNGRYELVPTLPGQYTLEVVVPNGLQPTLVNVGGNDAVDSDVDPAKVVIGAETTVQVGVDESATGDLDVGLVTVPVPAEPTTTVAPPTTAPTTEVPTTEVPTTVAPTTTPAPTTAAPTVPAPTTTPAPTTAVPTTPAPTPEPTTSAPAG